MPRGGPLKNDNDYDRLYIRERDGSQHRVAGRDNEDRKDGTHIVREKGRNGDIDYARINGRELTQEELRKINKA